LNFVKVLFEHFQLFRTLTQSCDALCISPPVLRPKLLQLPNWLTLELSSVQDWSLVAGWDQVKFRGILQENVYDIMFSTFEQGQAQMVDIIDDDWQ